MSRQEEFLKVLKKHGYRSVTNFCVENKLIQTNMSKRLRGDQGIEMLFMFKLANLLHEPVETMIEIFYPDEIKENRSLIED